MVPETRKGFIGVLKVVFDRHRQFKFRMFEHQGVHLDKNGIYHTVAKALLRSIEGCNSLGSFPTG